jgi:hypothetical protein
MGISTVNFIGKIFRPTPVLSSHGLDMAILNIQSRHDLDGYKKHVAYDKLVLLAKNLPRPQIFHLSRTQKDIVQAISSVAFGVLVMVESAVLVAVAVGFAGPLGSSVTFLVPAIVIPLGYVLNSIMRTKQKRHATSDAARLITVRSTAVPKSDRAEAIRASMDRTKYAKFTELPLSCISSRFQWLPIGYTLDPVTYAYAEFGPGNEFRKHDYEVGHVNDERKTTIMVELHDGIMMPLAARGVYDHVTEGINCLLQPTSSTQVTRAIDAALVFDVPEKIIEIIGTSHGASSGHGSHDFDDVPDSGRVSITGSLIEAGRLYCFSAGSIKSLVVSSGQLHDLTPDIQGGDNCVDALAGFGFGPAYRKKRKALTIASVPHAQVAGGILMSYNAAMARALGDDVLAAYVGGIKQGAKLDGEVLHLLMTANDNASWDVDSISDELPCLTLVRV